ncbi:MAG: hypothetical protein MI919_15770 [Holophagales bacterium]|nr:hypothetical protein [Holophagales bacterium]
MRPFSRGETEQGGQSALIEKAIDLIGLYLQPRCKAAALRVEPRAGSEVPEPLRSSSSSREAPAQAERGAPGLPVELEAALGAATGERLQQRGEGDFLELLQTLDRLYPGGEIHLVSTCVGCPADEHSPVEQWLARRPRYCVHHAPTTAAWSQLFEHWISLLTPPRKGRQSSANSVLVLERAVDLFISKWSGFSPAFRWIKTGEESLSEALLARFRDVPPSALD